jgi:large subunit ribosomal protein L29
MKSQYLAKDLRERSKEDLVELEKSITRQLFEARFKNYTNRLDDTSAIQKARKDLARVKTILNEKRNAGAQNEAK